MHELFNFLGWVLKGILRFFIKLAIWLAFTYVLVKWCWSFHPVFTILSTLLWFIGTLMLITIGGGKDKDANDNPEGYIVYSIMHDDD